MHQSSSLSKYISIWLGLVTFHCFTSAFSGGASYQDTLGCFMLARWLMISGLVPFVVIISAGLLTRTSCGYDWSRWIYRIVFLCLQLFFVVWITVGLLVQTNQRNEDTIHCLGTNRFASFDILILGVVEYIGCILVNQVTSGNA